VETSQGWTDRAARPQDADVLLEIEREANLVALAQVFPPETYPYPSADVLERWRRTLADPEVEVRLFAEAGRPERQVAFVAFDATTLRHLAVRPEAWGRGVARLAVEFATDRMQSPRLWVLTANTRARGLYEHLGWRPTGRTRAAEFPPYPDELELVR
jgi:GNAT superfamily N-acetyltransferase